MVAVPGEREQAGEVPKVARRRQPSLLPGAERHRSCSRPPRPPAEPPPARAPATSPSPACPADSRVCVGCAWRVGSPGTLVALSLVSRASWKASSSLECPELLAREPAFPHLAGEGEELLDRLRRLEGAVPVAAQRLLEELLERARVDDIAPARWSGSRQRGGRAGARPRGFAAAWLVALDSAG
jgi:hypothetical protein